MLTLSTYGCRVAYTCDATSRCAARGELQAMQFLTMQFLTADALSFGHGRIHPWTRSRRCWCFWA